MITNASPKVLTDQEELFMSNLNEYQKRQFLGIEALAFGKHGVDKISKYYGVSKNTVYSSIEEIKANYVPEKGRVRRPGGGRKALLPQHPEWIDTFKLVVAPHTAGLPQDENVIWVSLTVPQITREMIEKGCDVSEYIARQILESLGYRHRSFRKDIQMRDVEGRDAQFKNIAAIREQAAAAGLPIISIDTKKKELVGNFKRDGKVLCIGQPRSLDHDFATFSEAQIVPHGIYDVTTNTGYMTIGTSHDTSKFVCDNIERVWNNHLQKQYPDARTLVILCDGGGSNSSSHRIVKQDFMDLATELNMNLLVLHYPPYCSKYNPIEHRLFSQITRSWSGAPLLSVENAAERARATTTITGLTVHVDINDKTYDIKRPINESYDKMLKQRVVYQEGSSKWTYLVKPA